MSMINFKLLHLSWDCKEVAVCVRWSPGGYIHCIRLERYPGDGQRRSCCQEPGEHPEGSCQLYKLVLWDYFPHDSAERCKQDKLLLRFQYESMNAWSSKEASLLKISRGFKTLLMWTSLWQNQKSVYLLFSVHPCIKSPLVQFYSEGGLTFL